MALVIESFKESLAGAMQAAAEQNMANPSTTEDAIRRLADAIAEQVDAYVKTMTITIATGLVQVQGTPSAQANVAPIIIEGGVS